MSHPYKSQPPRTRWRSIAECRHPLEISGWYTKKFPVSELRIGTAGSCFAQHIGRELREKGFHYIDMEPAPKFLEPHMRAEHGYDIYSARYGNVYTTRQLLQLLQRALGEFQPIESHWISGCGHVDPFRPTIEPTPNDRDEIDALRSYHLSRVAKLFKNIDVLIFTMGMTEAWIDTRDGAVYPVAPGVAGGTFDPSVHKFVNFGYQAVRDDLKTFIDRARGINPQLRFMLTVSPVPLMATATDQHVIAATMYSKSVLRAVAGEMANQQEYVDYFPSYEIIASHVMRGQFYNSDMRTVNQVGVEHVMGQFFSEHAPPNVGQAVGQVEQSSRDDSVCDEELLDSFGA